MSPQSPLSCPLLPEAQYLETDLELAYAYACLQACLQAVEVFFFFPAEPNRLCARKDVSNGANGVRSLCRRVGALDTLRVLGFMGHSLAALHIGVVDVEQVWRKLKLDVLHFMLSEGWFSTQTERIKWSMGSGARPVQICPAKHRAAYSCAMVDIWEWMIRMGAMTSRFEHALRPENFFRREPPWLEYEAWRGSSFLWDGVCSDSKVTWVYRFLRAPYFLQFLQGDQKDSHILLGSPRSKKEEPCVARTMSTVPSGELGLRPRRCACGHRRGGCLAILPTHTWVWVKIKPPGDRRFLSLFPFAKVPFWVPISDPQPHQKTETLSWLRG